MMQTCSKCGVTLFVFGEEETTATCRRCRVADDAALGRGGEARAPFQRIGAKRTRPFVSIRAAGLIFTLVIVLATLSSLRDRASTVPASAPPPARSSRMQGAVEVVLPPPPTPPTPPTPTAPPPPEK